MRCPLPLPFSWGIWTPSNTWFLGPNHVNTQTASRSVQPFCRAANHGRFSRIRQDAPMHRQSWPRKRNQWVYMLLTENFKHLTHWCVASELYAFWHRMREESHFVVTLPDFGHLLLLLLEDRSVAGNQTTVHWLYLKCFKNKEKIHRSITHNSFVRQKSLHSHCNRHKHMTHRYNGLCHIRTDIDDTSLHSHKGITRGNIIINQINSYYILKHCVCRV